MQTYSSDKNIIACDIHTVYAKLSNPQVLQTQLEQHADRLPQEARDNLQKVQFTPQGISIESPMGNIVLGVTGSVEPSTVTYEAQNSPLAFNLTVSLEEMDENTTQAQAQIGIDIPIFLRAMVGNQLAEAAKKMGEMLALIPYRDL